MSQIGLGKKGGGSPLKKSLPVSNRPNLARAILIDCKFVLFIQSGQSSCIGILSEILQVDGGMGIHFLFEDISILIGLRIKFLQWTLLVLKDILLIESVTILMKLCSEIMVMDCSGYFELFQEKLRLPKLLDVKV